MAINKKFEPIVTFAPIWKAYYKNALRKMLNDGVQYLEFRGHLPKVYFPKLFNEWKNCKKNPILFIRLYDLDGREYCKEDAVAMYIEAMVELRNENPLSIGSKFIYSGGKFISKTISFEIIRRLHAKFPDFFGWIRFIRPRR